MECDKVRLHLIRYIDNDLPAPVQLSVEEHLDHCYLCQEELNEAVSLLDACRDALRHPAPCDQFDRLQAEIFPGMAVEASSPRRSWRRLRGFVAAAAVIMLIIGIGRPVARIVHEYSGIMTLAMSSPEGLPADFETGNPTFRLLLAWQRDILQAERQASDLSERDITASPSPEPERKKGNDPFSSRQPDGVRIVLADAPMQGVAKDAAWC